MISLGGRQAGIAPRLGACRAFLAALCIASIGCSHHGTSTHLGTSITPRPIGGPNSVGGPEILALPSGLFLPAPMPSAPQTYRASSMGLPHTPALSSDQRRELACMLRKTPARERQFLRFGFSRGPGKPEFIVFSTGGHTPDGDAGNGGYYNFGILNEASCNGGYDPHDGTVFAATGCLVDAADAHRYADCLSSAGVA